MAKADRLSARRGGRPSFWRGALGIAATLCVLTASFVASFYLTSWLYRAAGLHPSEPVHQVVTALAGLVLLAVPASVLAALHRPHEIAAFRSLMAAIGRIAQGDFGVRVETALPRGDHPFNQLVDSINDMAEELDRMEALRQEFISNVSHEIQSPLTSIGGFAKALQQDGMTTEERARYLSIIETESTRLSRLSDNLMRLAALEAEGASLRRRPFRLDRTLQRIILSAEPQWSARQLEVDAALRPVTITGDEALLDHVWANILHNAVKFTPCGGTVAVRLDSRDGGAVVEIVDSGIGIAPEDQARVFERFFKADRGRDRSVGGAGLGLALAQKVVALHDGRIVVQSEVGRGAAFRVFLPGARA